MSSFQGIADNMAANGRAALDNDSVYAQYQQLSPAEKAIADNMAANGRAALDNDSVYAQYQQLSKGTASPQSQQSQQSVQDPLLANSDTNGQMTFEQDAGQDATSKQEQGMGDPFATTPPDFLKRALFSTAADIEQHPIKAALNIGSLAIPIAGDYQIARSALSPIVKGLASAAINGGYEAARSKLSDGSVDPLSTGISTLAGGLGGLIGGHFAGKAVSNADDLAARQAELQEAKDAQHEILHKIDAANPTGVKVLPNQNSNRSVTISGPAYNISAYGPTPQQKLNTAKVFMAEKVYGGQISPQSISDLDAAKWITEQKANAANLSIQHPELAQLIPNYYNDIAPTDVKSLFHKNVVNSVLNPIVQGINKNQQEIGDAASLFSGLTPAFGSLSDYAIHKVAGN